MKPGQLLPGGSQIEAACLARKTTVNRKLQTRDEPGEALTYNKLLEYIKSPFKQEALQCAKSGSTESLAAIFQNDGTAAAHPEVVSSNIRASLPSEEPQALDGQEQDPEAVSEGMEPTMPVQTPPQPEDLSTDLQNPIPPTLFSFLPKSSIALQTPDSLTGKNAFMFITGFLIAFTALGLTAALVAVAAAGALFMHAGTENTTQGQRDPEQAGQPQPAENSPPQLALTQPAVTQPAVASLTQLLMSYRNGNTLERKQALSEIYNHLTRENNNTSLQPVGASVPEENKTVTTKDVRRALLHKLNKTITASESKTQQETAELVKPVVDALLMLESRSLRTDHAPLSKESLGKLVEKIHPKYFYSDIKRHEKDCKEQRELFAGLLLLIVLAPLIIPIIAAIFVGMGWNAQEKSMKDEIAENKAALIDAILPAEDTPSHTTQSP